MWGGLPPLSFLVVCFVWASVVWAGLEGVSRTEAAAGWPCAVVWGWLVVVLCGVGNTPACGGLLRLLWSWWSAGWWVPPSCCGGGMLSGFWGSAPWLPGLPFLLSFFVGGWGLVGALACVLVCVCGGGMLSGFWGSAPWLPDPSGAPACWGLWVGVGGLVVNCIVDASILL